MVKLEIQTIDGNSVLQSARAVRQLFPHYALFPSDCGSIGFAGIYPSFRPVYPDTSASTTIPLYAISVL